MTILDALTRARVVAIFRGDYSGRWHDFAEALMRGGISALEVTLNSPGAVEALADLRAAYGERILLGAGTVLSADEVERAADAGAAFIVSPDTDEAVIAATKRRGLVSIPGAYTPTEIRQAHRLGADIVKVFPAQSADYIRAVRGPLPHIPIMATGGVDEHNAAEFFAAGVTGLGIGGYLTKTTLTLDEVERRAAQFAALVGTAARVQP